MAEFTIVKTNVIIIHSWNRLCKRYFYTALRNFRPARELLCQRHLSRRSWNSPSIIFACARESRAIRSPETSLRGRTSDL